MSYKGHKSSGVAPGRFLHAALFILAVSVAFPAWSDPAEVKETPPGKRTITVTSDAMEADSKGKVIVFRGNVAAEEDFLLCSEELRLFYGPEETVEKISASGDVRIFQEERTAESREALYDRSSRTIILTGEPVVKRCADTVRGDKITVYLDEDRALVESSEGGGRVRAVIMPEKKCQGPASGPGYNPTENGTGGKARCKGSR